MRKILRKMALAILKRSHRKRFPGLPWEIKDLWYCGMWYMYRSDRHKAGEEYRSDYVKWPIEGKVLFNPFKCGLCGRDDSGLIDGLIPATRTATHIGLYQVTAHMRPSSAFYDGAPWDNGYTMDLEFVKAIPAFDGDGE